jgi:hypothetical protein
LLISTTAESSAHDDMWVKQQQQQKVRQLDNESELEWQTMGELYLGSPWVLPPSFFWLKIHSLSGINGVKEGAMDRLLKLLLLLLLPRRDLLLPKPSIALITTCFTVYIALCFIKCSCFLTILKFRLFYKLFYYFIKSYTQHYFKKGK